MKNNLLSNRNLLILRLPRGFLGVCLDSWFLLLQLEHCIWLVSWIFRSTGSACSVQCSRQSSNISTWSAELWFHLHVSLNLRYIPTVTFTWSHSGPSDIWILIFFFQVQPDSPSQMSETIERLLYEANASSNLSHKKNHLPVSYPLANLTPVPVRTKRLEY